MNLGHYHGGWTHEGVGRHPRQDGWGLFHRLGKLQANLQTLRIYWRPILIEVIVPGMRNIEAGFQVVIGSHSAVIPTWKLCGDEGDAHFSFPGVEGDCFPCRGWRHCGRGWRMLNWSNGDGHITLSFQKQGVTVNAICWQWFIMLKCIRCEQFCSWFQRLCINTTTTNAWSWTWQCVCIIRCECLANI